MMKFFLPLFLFFFIFQDSNLKYWDEGPLFIDDFQGEIPEEIDVNVKAGINYSLEFTKIKDKIIVRAEMDRNLSYTRKDTTGENELFKVLKHEQVHLDIVELWARKERKLFKTV
jgi:hypothetical protein